MRRTVIAIGPSSRLFENSKQVKNWEACSKPLNTPLLCLSYTLLARLRIANASGPSHIIRSKIERLGAKGNLSLNT